MVTITGVRTSYVQDPEGGVDATTHNFSINAPALNAAAPVGQQELMNFESCVSAPCTDALCQQSFEASNAPNCPA
jgi:hypothetical protein